MVDIIIACYQVPITLLRRCLDSIKTQTYQDFHVLLVDDGSDQAYLSEYRNLHYSFLTILFQNHQGVSAARNLALSKSTGNFVTFIDGDDTVSPMFLEEALSLQERTDADIVCGCITWKYRNGEIVSTPCISIGDYRVYNDNDRSFLIHYLLSDKVDENHRELSGFSNGSCSGKLIRGNLARQVRFINKVAYREDRFFNIQCMQKARRTVIVNRQWYLYYQYASSAVHGINHAFHDAFAPSMHFLRSLYESDISLLHEVTWTRRDIMERMLFSDILARDKKCSLLDQSRLISAYFANEDFSELLKNCAYLKNDRAGNLMDTLIVRRQYTLICLIIKVYLLLRMDQRVPAGNGYQLFSKEKRDTE